MEVVSLSTTDAQAQGDNISENEDTKFYSGSLIRERARLLAIITLLFLGDFVLSQIFYGKGSTTHMTNTMTIVVLLVNVSVISFLCFIFALIFEFKLTEGRRLKFLTYLGALAQFYSWSFVASSIYGAIVTWVLVYLLSSCLWTAACLFMRRTPTPGAKFLYSLGGNTLLLLVFIVVCSMWGKVQILEFLLAIISCWLLLLFPVAKLLDTRVQCDILVHILYFISIVGPLQLIVGLTFNAVSKISEFFSK
jgi:hypothetical protein